MFLIPALVALASLVLARGSLLPAEAARGAAPRPAVAAPAILYSAYVLMRSRSRGCRSWTRSTRTSLRHSVRLAAAAGLRAGSRSSSRAGRAWPARRARRLWSPRVATALVAAVRGVEPGPVRRLGGRPDLRELRGLAGASAGRCRPDTLVQGKLANGLALENRIRPIFIGHEFGNYADRKERDDVRYILTYTNPRLGYEGSQITGRARRLSRVAHHHDFRRRGNAVRPRQRRSDREACAPLTSAPSRRTPTCVSAPNTTTRCSSTTAARRSSRSSSAPAWPCAAACSTPDAAAAACRCRSRKKRARSSASIPINRFGDAGVRLGRERGVRHLHFALADGMALPFTNGAFDLVLSHAVIEHVADAPLLPARMRAGPRAGRTRLPVDRAVSVVCGRAPAAAEDPGAAAPAVRPARSRSPTFTFLARHAHVDAEGAGERELVHQAGAQG